MKQPKSPSNDRQLVKPGDDISKLDAAIGIQESTKTVVLLNRDIIKGLMERTSCVSIRQAGQIANTIIKLRCPDLEPIGWELGTLDKELSEYLTSFLVDKHKHETVLVGGEHANRPTV